MTERPNPGDVVRLNEHGMDSVGGLRTHEEIRQAQRMVITSVSAESLTEPEETWQIEVDQPLINRFILTSYDVDLVSAASILSQR